MIVTCGQCSVDYDDAVRLTICPHNRFMRAEDLQQKIAGLALLGRRVRFRSGAFAREDVRRVWAVGWEGLVSLEGLAGEYAPSLLEVVR
jgi:hypothetical protein